MDSRYLSADASASIPSPDDALAQGFPTEGNTDLGVLATRIGAWWFYQVGEEIRNCITAAGITPDKTKVNQLTQAIRLLCDIPFASTSVFGKVKLSNNVNDTAQNTAPTSLALSQTWAEATRDASISTKGRVKLSNNVNDTAQNTAPTSLALSQTWAEATRDASISTKGRVKLSNNVNDTAQNTAPTSFALSQTWTEATRNASLSAKGRVKLVNSVSSTSTSEAATPNSVKVAYDKGVDAYNLAASHQDHLTPTGAVCMFLSNAVPSGWLKLVGQTIYRSQYPSLFTKMGWGDSVTLPNMNGRFPEGSNSPGQYKSAGLPNITGTTQTNDDTSAVGGAFRVERQFGTDNHATLWYQLINEYQVSFDASRSNPIYGNSSTVQPNSVTFVYAIKVI